MAYHAEERKTRHVQGAPPPTDIEKQGLEYIKTASLCSAGDTTVTVAKWVLGAYRERVCKGVRVDLRHRSRRLLEKRHVREVARIRKEEQEAARAHEAIMRGRINDTQRRLNSEPEMYTGQFKYMWDRRFRLGVDPPREPGDLCWDHREGAQFARAMQAEDVSVLHRALDLNSTLNWTQTLRDDLRSHTAHAAYGPSSHDRSPTTTTDSSNIFGTCAKPSLCTSNNVSNNHEDHEGQHQQHRLPDIEHARPVMHRRRVRGEKMVTKGSNEGSKQDKALLRMQAHRPSSPDPSAVERMMARRLFLHAPPPRRWTLMASQYRLTHT